MQSTTCQNCGHTFEGKYCNHCGQKKYTEEDKSLKHILPEVFHFLTHFEGSFLRTVKTVLLHPARLSSDYCAGKRKIYYKPISFYLLIVVLYLLFPLASGMNMDMRDYKSSQWTGPLIKRQIEVKAGAKRLDEASLAEKFHQISGKTSKVLLLLLIPFSALAIALLHYRQKKYVFDHFILATEFNAFYLLVIFLLLPLLLLSLFRMLHIADHNIDIYVQPVLVGLLWIYTMLLFRRFYGERWLPAIVRSLAFCFIFGWLILPLYRFIIFEITFALI